jgi:spore coat polysaccharide biosynthesis protein SpsF
MKPTVTAIIQARMNSTRLPGKAFMKLGGKPLLQHVFERTLAVRGTNRVVLATCVGDDNHPIIELAESMGIGVFIGSEENVLERFFLASERFGGDYILRVTGDNPFTDPEFAERTVEFAINTAADLFHFTNLPLGTGVGIIKKTALDAAYLHSDSPHQREHVTPYIWERPDRFTIVQRESGIDNPFPNLRLTVDTPEDFKLADIVYSHCYRGTPFPLSTVIAFLRQNPGFVEINSGVIQRPMTHSSA